MCWPVVQLLMNLGNFWQDWDGIIMVSFSVASASPPRMCMQLPGILSKVGVEFMLPVNVR